MNRKLILRRNHSRQAMVGFLLGSALSLVLLLAWVPGGTGWAADPSPPSDAVQGSADLNFLQGTGSAHVEAGSTQSFQQTGTLGTVQGSATAGANADGQFTVSPDSVDAKLAGTIGLAAELEAVSQKFQAGNEDVNAGAQLDAKVEALIGAQGTLAAHIDQNGITLGADAQAGAYVSAEAKAEFGFDFFGLQTSATVSVEGHAGALAEGQAIVTIGFDGKIKFKLGAGLAVGLGASADIEFEVDASQLLAKLGLADLASLLKWLDEFQKDPKAYIDQLVNQAVKAVVEQGLELVRAGIDEAGKWVGDTMGDLIRATDPSLNSIANLLSPLPPSLGDQCQQPSYCDVANAYVKYAQQVYQNDTSALQTPIGNGPGAEVDAARSTSSGMYAQVFRNPNNPNEFILAFRGTEPKTLTDWLANLSNGLIGTSQQQYDAVKYAQEVQEVISRCYPGAKVTIVGHSLGGELAQLASYATGYPAVTFNPAALGNFPGRDDNRFGELCINNFVDAYDILHILANPITDLLGVMGQWGGIPIPGTRSVGTDTLLGYGDPEILTKEMLQGPIMAGIAAHLLGDENKPGPLVQALLDKCEEEETVNGGGGSSTPQNPPLTGDTSTDPNGSTPSSSPGSVGTRMPPANSASGDTQGMAPGGRSGASPAQPDSSTKSKSYQRKDQKYGK